MCTMCARKVSTGAVWLNEVISWVDKRLVDGHGVERGCLSVGAARAGVSRAGRGGAGRRARLSRRLKGIARKAFKPRCSPRGRGGLKPIPSLGQAGDRFRGVMDEDAAALLTARRRPQPADVVVKYSRGPQYHDRRAHSKLRRSCQLHGKLLRSWARQPRPAHAWPRVRIARPIISGGSGFDSPLGRATPTTSSSFDGAHRNLKHLPSHRLAPPSTSRTLLTHWMSTR